MDLDLLADFLELAKEASFSRAAELRNVTQPAFSRRIRSLEAWVGTLLVQRTSRSVALTPAGMVFQSRAAAIVRALSEARGEALEAAGQAEGALSLAATHALSFTFVPRWLMQVAGPAAVGTLNMVSDGQRRCERLMVRGDVRFFVCHRYPTADSGLPVRQFDFRQIGEDSLVPLCAPDSRGVSRWSVDADGDAVPFIAYGSASGLNRILEAHWAAHGRPALAPRMRSVLAATNLELAKEGQGVAWLPLSLAAEDVAAGHLVRAGGPQWDVPVQIVVYRPKSRLSPHAERFWQRIVALEGA